MRKRYYLVLLSIAMITTSLVMMSVPVMAADGDVTFDLTAYYYANSGIIPGVDPDPGLPPYYGWVLVDVYVDASKLTNKGSDGMIAWGIKVIVDPAVLTPQMAVGGDVGYFMYDMSYANWPPPPFPPGAPMPYPPSFLQSVGTDYIECAESFLPTPPAGQGVAGVGKLCSLYFTSNSLTAYTELTIDMTVTGGVSASGYTDATNTKYAIYPVDGHYNMPPNGYLFETPTGGTFPTGDPIGTDWHEIEPNFCHDWTLESWEDNGDGKLSPSDQIDMIQTNPPDPNTYWFHVEWVNPAPVAGDGIADMFVTQKPDVPEFPLGVGMLMMLAPLIPIIYLWRRKGWKK